VEEVAGDDAVVLRLLELGLVPGTTVLLVKRAPLGDPLELRLRGYHLSVRVAEAALVQVRPA
jgi:Fe2+ transport system protein FeoA